MFKKRFILALGVLSLLLTSLAFVKPLAKLSSTGSDEATDFYQRHPGWTWAINDQKVIPLTGDLAFPDYHQRHRELSVSPVLGVGASDYFQRHPELNVPAERSVDTTDYFFRHLDSNTSSPVITFSAEQIRREYFLGERYGVTPRGHTEEQALREYWLGERYGQTP